MGLIDNLKVLAGKKDFPDKKPEAPKEPQKKVLIIEDERALADRLAATFNEAGFATVKAENGEIGLELAKSKKPDLIILDLLMPVMDGKIMLRKLREDSQYKRIPVIVLTNAGEIENIRETQSYYRAEEFFIKSNVSMEEIVNKAKNLTGIIQVITPKDRE